MADPYTVFIHGIEGKLLTPPERMLYFYEWKVIFSIIAAVLSLGADIFVFHQPYGDMNQWLVFMFWIIFMVLESYKKYDALFHKDNIIVDALVAQAVTFFHEHGIPVPPDVPDAGEEVRK